MSTPVATTSDNRQIALASADKFNKETPRGGVASFVETEVSAFGTQPQRTVPEDPVEEDCE